VADRQGPILSAYLSVNADIPENQGRAYLVRLRDAMNAEGVPEELQQQVREYLGSETHPGARRLAIFAAEDGLFEVYRLQVDVPESFRWGDPYVAPLTLLLDEYEPYGAAVLDAERFRYFVVSPLSSAWGEEEVRANGFREVDVHPSQPYPRGGTDFEPASRRTEAHVHRFYKELGELTRDLTFREGVQRLILAGPREDRRVSSHPPQRGQGQGSRRGTRRSRSARGRAPGQARGHQGACGARAREGAPGRVRESGVRGLDETIAAPHRRPR
jgi:hypothetical protein